jgi:hypothetical protein
MTVMTAERIAWAVENVVYRHTNYGIVYAFWTPSLEKAATLKTADLDALLVDDDIILVAEATRYYQSEGATFSGWVIASGRNSGDPVPNKPEAMAQMRVTVADLFNR